MNNNRINGVTVSLVLLFACGLYALMALWGGLDQTIQALKSIDVLTGVLVMVLVTAGYLLRYVRWQYYLRKLGYDVPNGPNLRIFLASFLMAISPGKVGEAMKSYFLKKEYGVPATPTVAAFFCERFTDVAAMVVLSGAGFLIYPHGGWAMALIVSFLVMTLVVLQRETWIETLVFRPLGRFESLETWVDRGRRFYGTSGELLATRPLGLGTVLGVVSWGLEGLCLYLILVGMGIGSISPVVAVFVFSASVLLGAASMLPGGLGGSEAIMVAMLMYFGVDKSSAVSATIIVRFVTLWYGVLLGAVTWGMSTRALAGLEDS